MDPVRWMTLIALGLFFAEGFTLSMFPVQFQQLLQEIDPKLLQAAGLLEIVVAVSLMAGLLLG
ncbi:MAG TPA: hypothetical protein VG713_22725 [Pirellulales bacterium]|nr:hypothetical protein [Pirellulales bacterium]